MSPRRAKLLGAIFAVLVAALWVFVSKLGPPPCGGAVFFELRPPLTDPGRYQVRIDLDRGERVCEFAIELPLTRQPSKDRCPMALELETQGHRQATQLRGLAIGASPGAVELSLSKGKELLYAAQMKPRYSPYSVEPEPGQRFCGERSQVSPKCLRGTSACWPFRANCDGPEDCAGGRVCCVDPEWGASYGPGAATECASKTSCLDRLAELACHTDRDCLNGTKCRQAPYAQDFVGGMRVCR